eukprot:990722-Amorphochlora_amoeboformis.AAC.2
MTGTTSRIFLYALFLSAVMRPSESQKLAGSSVKACRKGAAPVSVRLSRRTAWSSQKASRYMSRVTFPFPT